MSEFFESEIVREELEEINDLQQELYGNSLNFPALPPDEQKEHIEKLTYLLEKQRVMYTRLNLSDDPEAIKMKENLQQSVQMMGFPKGTDINLLFNNMAQTINNLKQIVDK
tara:strand:+ start:160 stop:492 length:333 start_codon:yes stop_codon:yes gene_type:complete